MNKPKKFDYIYFKFNDLDINVNEYLSNMKILLEDYKFISKIYRNTIDNKTYIFFRLVNKISVSEFNTICNILKDKLKYNGKIVYKLKNNCYEYDYITNGVADKIDKKSYNFIDDDDD